MDRFMQRWEGQNATFTLHKGCIIPFGNTFPFYGIPGPKK